MLILKAFLDVYTKIVQKWQCAFLHESKRQMLWKVDFKVYPMLQNAIKERSMVFLDKWSNLTENSVR